MGLTFVAGNGNKIFLGKKLGEGGEGAVFEVENNLKLVAKIYQKDHLPDVAKQKKLNFMVSNFDSDLLKIAAWPQIILRESINSGQICGFLMEKVINRLPIHTLYSPAHRKKVFPEANWGVLLCAAHNIAAVFEKIHQLNHVIGDVNQGNLLVDKKGTVILIDCDSFQIEENFETHLCHVGVSHFTPPELSDFLKVRTPNHDNFGLAVLIFHLLFGGRHPFSGVPFREGVSDSLEDDIKHFRYAYSNKKTIKEIGPPPNSVPIQMVPVELLNFFEIAFSEEGAQGKRPTAEQWKKILRETSKNLFRCGVNKGHIYPQKNKECPWCCLESKGIKLFLNLGGILKNNSKLFDLKVVFEQIMSLPVPKPIPIPFIKFSSIKPRQLSSNIIDPWLRKNLQFCAIAIALTLTFFFPGSCLLVWIIAIVAIIVLSNFGFQEWLNEKEIRRKARDAAEYSLNEFKSKIDQEFGPDKFLNKRENIHLLKMQYLELPDKEKKEITDLLFKAKERQMIDFLENFFIDDASITGIGLERKLKLSSFGIETAADIEENKIRQIKGFGEVYTQNLIFWRRDCEAKFVFDTKKSVTDIQKNAITDKYNSRKSDLEKKMLEGLSDLVKYPKLTGNHLVAIELKMYVLASNLAQAKADFEFMK